MKGKKGRGSTETERGEKDEGRAEAREGWMPDKQRPALINYGSQWTPVTPSPPLRHPSHQRCFLALARTRPSNTALMIVLWAVWNGFSVVCTASVSSQWYTLLPYLHVELPYLHKERPDPVVVLALVEEHELHVLCIMIITISQ
jgi:hypothetical protein